MILRSSSKNSKRILPKVVSTSKHFFGELPEIKTHWKKDTNENRIRFDTIRKQVLPFLKSEKSSSVKLKGFKENQTVDKKPKIYNKHRSRNSILVPAPFTIDSEEVKYKNQYNLLKQARKKTESSIQILQIMNQVSSNIHKQYNQTLTHSVELE